jgi:hypothetical protein
MIPQTPLEITDYKRNWKSDNPFIVTVHSDLHIETKDWCRRNLERYQWSMDRWTAPYEHTFFFEFNAHAMAFKDRNITVNS